MSEISTAESYLHDFHQRKTGATSAAFGHLPAISASKRHASSYDVLASLVEDSGVPRTVLDLGCGDGYLLKRLCARRQSALRLIGVDMSESELAAARATLPAEVLLLNERAQQLSLPPGTVDYVLSHMAMMLMGDIEQVLRVIRRVLRRGGTFATVVGRGGLLGELQEIFVTTFKPIATADLSSLRFGDPRTRTISGWTDLLADQFAHPTFEDIDVRWTPKPDELWQALSDTYDIDRLSPSARTCLRQRLLDAVAHLQQPDGTIPTGWALRLVHAEAAAFAP